MFVTHFILINKELTRSELPEMVMELILQSVRGKRRRFWCRT